MGRLADDEAYRVTRAANARAAAETQTFTDVARELEEIYEELRTRKRASRRESDPLADRDWIVVDLHMHTNASHDCRVAPELLLEHAEAEGLGAIAITDHNVFHGAQQVVELARDRDIVVIPGEEVKTDGQGEVIGLFLKEEIPRGLSFGDTIAAIKAQGGLVYLPHPFDRMHAIPDAATLHGHLSQIDVFEVYNARLLFETYNDEALRFARKYNLVMGAGSDAHVLQGLGTGAVRMRAFHGPEEFLLSLRSAEILRRPKSLLYLQSLKWAAQAKERVR
jgi:predicted metal-dependent phosphoesterase TrpH